MYLRRRTASLLFVVPFVVACGTATQSSAVPAQAPQQAAGQPSPAPVTASPSPSGAGVAASAPAPAGALHFEVVPQESTATFRVREQLAGVQFPNDAVGTTGMVSGQLVLREDGTVVSESSKVVVDLRDLKTDDNRRDNFIKSNTLQTNRFPTAEFVPVSLEGAPSPLPAAGEHTFRMIGRLTIRGVTRDQTWDVTARREGNAITGTAKTSFRFGDFNMTQPRVPLVLSIVDDIRVEIDLVARQA